MGIRSKVVAAIAAAMIVTPALAGAASAGGSADATSRGVASSDFGRDRLAAVGLADGGTSLVSFRTDQPSKVKGIGAVSGLDGDAKLVGIDHRVQNGKLYGVGNAGGIYVLSTSDAKAGKVGQLSVALSGSAFGVDFNPAANALRVISDNGQNLRQPFPATGDAPTAPTVADTGLTLPPVAPNPAATATGVSAAAYTNNDLDATTGTTLFDINTALDQVAIQSPANSGTLVPTGGLGIDADLDAGFDIYSKLRGGRTVDVTGFATLTSGGLSALYSVDLLGGAVDRVGKFPMPVTDIAVVLDQR
ncbi:MAG TPA: DUF4394 domain-containing protein [Nakamurella sp.]